LLSPKQNLLKMIVANPLDAESGEQTFRLPDALFGMLNR